MRSGHLCIRTMNLCGVLIFCVLLLWEVKGQQQHQEEEEEDIPPDAASMAFVFDGTGSMFDDLQQVKTGASKIFQTIMERRRESPIYNYVLVPFHDPEIGPLTVTTKEEQFLANLDDIYVHGGGDCPEMSVGAIKLALENALPGSFVYVFTDASAKDYLLLNPVLDLIQKKQSQVVFVLTGDCGDTNHPGYKVYEIIAATSSGQVFNLKKDDVEKVLAFVRVSLQARRVNLLSVTRQNNGSSDRLDLVVDETLSEFTVSVSGDKPKVDVYNPQGNIVDEKDGLKELLDLEHVKIVNVKDPDPGKWQVELESDSVHSVRATGLSHLDFVYGFSVKDTNDMSETRHRPLKGLSNTILINATKPEDVDHLIKVEVIDLNGGTIASVPLSHVDGLVGVYKGEFPDLSDNYFYLQVHGVDKNGHPLRRITATAVSPALPDSPVVTSEAQVRRFVGDAADIMCNILSDVPYTASWWKDDVPVGERGQFSEPASISLKIPSLAMESEGNYECIASNIGGMGRSITYVDVKGIPPTIISTKKEQLVTNGDNVELQCVAHGVPVPVISWKKGGHPIQETALVQVSGTGHLLLRDVQESDAGMYTCVAENEAGKAEDDVLVAVGMHPRIVQGPVDVEIDINNNLTLQCVVIGLPIPSIEWTKRGKRDWNGSRIRKLEGGNLWIGNIQPEDEGSYSCTVENNFGREQSEAYVRVTGLVEPVLEEIDPKLYPRQGETIQLKCTILHGVPPPELTWYKDGKLISETEDMKLLHGGSFLVIRHSMSRDDGEYTCLASNAAGHYNISVGVHVQVPPSILGDTTDYVVKEGDRIVLPCQVTGNNPLTITWQKSGVPVLPYHRRYKIQRDNSLEIKSAQENDSGTYVCTAVNRAGVSNKALILAVEVPPKIVTAMNIVRIPQGKEVTIPCEARGIPTPDITWEKDGVLIRPEDPSYVLLANGGIRLFASTLDSGTFICHATNKLGTAFKMFDLHVLVPPLMISAGNDVVVVKEGEPVSISCLSHGVPTPQLEWHKDGKKVEETDPHLLEYRVDHSTVQTAGVYTCVASNELGSVERTVRLVVQAPPRVAGFPAMMNVTVGEPFVVRCNATGVPEPEVMWLRKEEGEIHRVGIGKLITLDAIYLHQGGQYICLAKNDHGEDQKILTVNVMVPPTLQNDSSLRVREVIEGDPVQLICPVEGIPLPSVFWYKYDEPLSLNTNERSDLVHISLTDDPRSMTIYESRPSDAGNYTCKASNAAGHISVDFQLDVLTLPHFKDYNYDSNRVIGEGEDTSLECEVQGNPTPQVSWKKKDGDMLTLVQLIKPPVDADGSLLRIQNAQAFHAGTYRCEAYSRVGMIFRDFSVQVQGAPDLDGVSYESVEVLEGSPVTLTCPVFGSPRPYIEWRKDGSSSFLGEQNVIIRKHGAELEIPSAVLNDEAQYICMGKNKYGSSGEKHFNVTVLVLPYIKMSDEVEKVRGKEGDNITLVCNAEGNPSPDITWTHNGQNLYMTGENVGISGQHKEEFWIAEACVSDAGDYVCIATNKVGSTQKEYVVDVLVPPTLANPTSKPDKLEVLEGSSVTFACLVQGTPLPHVVWKKDDIPLDLEKHSFMEATDHGQYLHMNITNARDAGIYTCMATNEVGHVVKEFDLNVLVGPKIEEEDLPQHRQVKEGQPLILKCPAVGHPPPQIVWLKNNNPVTPDTIYGIHINDEDMSLNISAASVDHTGSYTCIVTNAAGETEKEFDVDVLVPPKLEMDKEYLDTELSVRVNRPITLHCPVAGRPAPELFWKKDGVMLSRYSSSNVQFSSEKRQLRIMSAKDSDAGTYECDAINEAGKITIPFHVTVLTPPHFLEDSVKTRLRVPENENVILTCPVMGSPEVSILWLKDGHLLPVTQGLRHKREADASSRMFVSDDAKQFVVVNATTLDAGKYTCIVSNEAGNAELDFRVDVLMKPTLDLSEVKKVIEVSLNRPVIFYCPVRGIPFPSVRWLKDGLPISYSGGVRYTTSADGRRLKLRYTEMSDAGKYTCMSVNEVGQVHQDFELRVLVPPTISGPSHNVNEIFGFSLPNLIPGVEGGSITLECNASGYPEPTIMWLKDGDLIEAEDNPDKYVFHDQMRSFEVVDLDKEDGGKYTCMALNSVGSAELNYDVEVWTKPGLMHQVTTDSVVIINYPTVLECPIDGYPPPEVTWMKDVDILDDSDDHLVRITNGGQQLQILRSLPTHRGNYTCLAHNEAGSVQVPYSLDIWEPPTIHTSHDKPSVREGDNVTFVCVPKGHPTPLVIWFHEGDLLISESLDALNASLLDSGHKLFINEATQGHRGKYTCLASSLAGSAELAFLLSVNKSPIIAGSQKENMTVMVNRPLILECSVDAKPEAHMTWLKNGRPLRITSPNDFQLILGDQRLHVPSTQEGDGGVYECVAKNELGEARRQFEVEILVPPKLDDDGTPYVSDRESNILEYQTADINCYVRGNPPPSVLWMKDGKDITPEERRIQMLENNQVLRIAEAKADDGGRYTCIAVSPSGKMEKDFSLVVQAPPTIISSSPNKVTALPNQPAHLECQSVANPDPQTKWLKNGEPLNDSSDPLLLVQSRGQELLFRQVRLSDAAKYTCIAYNSVGQDEKSFNLEVNTPPVISRPVSHQKQVLLDNSLTLSCVASGNPTPVFTWLKDEDQIQDANHPRYTILSEGSLLRIDSAQLTDSGVFKCVAANSVGRDELQLPVDVIGPPRVKKREAPNRVEVVEGKPFVIECPIDGTPEPMIMWQKEGDNVSMFSHPTLEVMDGGKVIKILKAVPTDSGLYKCLASNVAGQMDFVTPVDVLVPPKMNGDGKHVHLKVLEHHVVTLLCTVTGNPLPRITWLRNEAELDSDTGNLKILPSQEQIRIHNVSNTDAANYTCVASNAVGLAKKSFSLEVLAPPAIGVAPNTQDQAVVEGEKIEFECPVRGNPKPRILWYRDTELLQYQPGVQISEDGTKIEISSVKVSDSGTYTCMAVNEAGEDEAFFDLEVFVLPYIEDNNDGIQMQVILHHPITFECKASGVPLPAITWLKDNMVWEPEKQINLQVMERGQTIQILDTLEDDSASYTCLAQNMAGEAEKHYQLDVLVPPDIVTSSSRRSLQIVHNEGISIECPVKGDPLPEVIWLKDGVPLDGSNERIQVESEGTELTIAAAQVTDAGEYKCVAANEAGTKEATTVLNVVVPPTISDAQSSEYLDVTANHPVTLLCPAAGVPGPKIEWRKDGTELPQKEGPTLTFKRVQVEHGGVYECRASNTAGMARKLFQVNVNVPPVIQDSSTDTLITITIGEPFSLQCATSGTPPPTIYWVKDGDSFHFYPNLNLTLLNENQEAFVKVAQLQHHGKYSCHAKNIAGKDSRKFEVIILEPPRVTTLTPRLSAIRGESVALKCSAQGYPKPQITWSKGGKDLSFLSTHYQFRNGNIEIKMMHEEDVGVYTCTATNEAGVTSQDIQLDIKVPPSIHPSLQDLTVIEGYSVALGCKANGQPPPKTVWMFEAEALDNKRYGYQMMSDGTLHIDAAKMDHTGTYNCLAQNDVGSSQAARKLQVLVPPSIQEKQLEYSATVGEEVTLHCTSKGSPLPTTRWERNTKPLNLQDPRFMMLPSGNLKISLSQSGDMGTYRCVVENQAGVDHRIMSLEVKVPPSVMPGHTSYSLQKGGPQLLIPCRASGFPLPKISWTHNGSPVTLEGSSQQEVHPLGDLILRRAEPNMTGIYICAAINEVGKAYREVNVEVTYAPVFVELPEDKIVTLMESVNLTCLAKGHPIPNVTWLHNSGTLEGHPSVAGKSVLQIMGVKQDHAGVYTCVARNSIGEKRASAILVVKAPPKLMYSPKPQSAKMSGTATLDCMADGDPLPQVLWVKDGRRLDMSSKVHMMPNGSLVIYNLDDEDEGRYKCVASNEVGAAEGTAELIVHRPPIIVAGPRNAVVDLGDTVTLQCKAEGSPPPTLRWSGEKGDMSSRHVVLSNGSLQIVAAQVEDEGSYTCHAKNKMGLDSLSGIISVRVHGSWSAWGPWESCSDTCGSGVQTRWRHCSSPSPRNGGRDCLGQARDSRECPGLKPCPRHGGWGPWGEWSRCSCDMGDGTRVRVRVCDAPSPQNGGTNCPGQAVQSMPCACSEAQWGAWGGWSECSVSCGSGQRSRHRQCKQGTCRGSDVQRSQCGGECPPEKWTGQVRGNVKGRVNGKDVMARLTGMTSERGTMVAIDAVSKQDSKWMLNLPSIASGVYWSGATEHDGNNGYTLAAGRFRKTTHIDFGGKRLTVTHDGRGVDESGTMILDIRLDGEVPADFSVSHDQYAEDYVQLRPGELHSEGRASYHSEGRSGEYKWNEDVQYDGNQGLMKHIAQRMYTRAVSSHYNEGRQEVRFDMSSIVTKAGDDCPQGYTRSNSGNFCQDVNECETRRPCSHFCANTIGGYTCSCPTGYGLEQSGSNCEDVDECALSPQACQQQCINTHGSFHCECHPGYHLGKDGCEDVDECGAGTHRCTPSQACQNMPGSYRCVTTQCPHGYRLDSSGSCVGDSSGHDPQYAQGRQAEVSSFQFPPSVPSSDAEAFQFQFLAEYLTPLERGCPDGYVIGEGGRCEDYDECQYERPCEHRCVNTRGGYRCECPQGYTLEVDGSTCHDINECEHMSCPGACFNTYGGARCVDISCPKGYTHASQGEQDFTASDAHHSLTSECALACMDGGRGCYESLEQKPRVVHQRFVGLPEDRWKPYEDLAELNVHTEAEGRPRGHITFRVIENNSEIPFRVRLQEGKGIVYALKSVESETDYRLKIDALVHNEEGQMLYLQRFRVLIAVGNPT